MKIFVDTGGWISVVVQVDQYHDQNFSFTDCTSFVLAQQVGGDEVFGFDQHFSIFGFNVKPLW